MADQIHPVFLTVPEIKRVLEQLGQVPRKRHGQNFIHSWPAIQHVLDLCTIGPGDTVIEVGPGLGAFTLNMARRVKHVHAIELNPRFADYLQDRAKDLGITNLTVENGDALELEFPAGYSIVFSAMPYSISAPLTFKVLDYLQHHPARAFLTCQKEFGEKLVARPGSMDYGRLTANASLFSRVEVMMHVSRNNFYPVPDVDSVLVQLLPREQLPAGVASTCLVLTRGLFPFKNKVLRKAMALHLENVGKEIGRPVEMEPGQHGALDTMPFKEKRVRELTADDFQALAGWYATLGENRPPSKGGG